jgi:uncharacterized repeat protein (TIGR03847 family)
MEDHYEFDTVAILAAVAVGPPGKRTFFLVVGDSTRWLRVWLEKEQLQALAMAVRQLLFNLSQQASRPTSPAPVAPVPDVAPSGLPAAELEIEGLSLGYETDSATLSISARGIGRHKQHQTVLDCRVSLAQVRQLGRQADAACSAGRPRCIVCGGPIDPAGHVCPGSN